VKLQPNPANQPKVAATAPAAPASAAGTRAENESDDETAKPDPARAGDPWYQFVEQVKKSNSLLGAMLENTHLISTEGKTLTIGVPKKMSFMFDKVKDPDNVKRIETFLQTLWNKTYSVDVKLADEKTQAAAKPTPKAQQEQKKADQIKSVETQVENDPLVQQAQNVFKAQIKSIKES
jgi:hypothetical protein